MAKQDKFTRSWITENSIEVVSRYDPGILTLRGLHYQLVAIGMTNTVQHYKRVVSAMIVARREGLIDYEAFSDHDRSMIGTTHFEETNVHEAISDAKKQIENWMKYFHKNRWENQPYYVEVFIEKKALQGVFGKPCQRNRVALGACKGYPSLTFLNDTAIRFQNAVDEGKKPVIIYFGDYDPSGEDIPRSIGDNLSNDFGVDVLVHRVALMEHQVVEWNLPHAPAKKGDSRTANWGGLGQVELDAVSPEKLVDLCEDAIGEFFDDDLFEELKDQEKQETKVYQEKLKTFVNNLKI
tara:strand:- start:32948 stop:33832 length:885 start_codon:yes stop_codon:yes gene_type:complete